MNRRAFFGILIALLTATYFVAPQVAFSLTPKECKCPMGCSPVSQKSCPASCAFKTPAPPPACASATVNVPAPVAVVETINVADIQPTESPLLTRWNLRDEIPRSLHTPFIDASRAPPMSFAGHSDS